MDVEAARARAEAILAAWNQRDYNAVAENVSPNVVLMDHVRGRKAEGPQGYVNRFKPTLDAFEDMQGETVSFSCRGQPRRPRNHVAGPAQRPPRGEHRNDRPTGEQVSVHLAIHSEVNDDGRPAMIRTYGTTAEMPSIAHASGSG